MTQALHFFLSSSRCKTEGKTGFFNIVFTSRSMAGKVWNETLANFFANICHQKEKLTPALRL